MRLVPLALILSAIPSLQAQPARDPFPADFTPAPCAPNDSCQSFDRSSLPSAAFNFLGLQLDPLWVQAHADIVKKFIEPACRRHATCLATLGDSFTFCNDVLARETSSVCDKLFPRSAGEADWLQCSVFHETYLLGVDQRSKPFWDLAQECATKTPATHTRPPDLWMVPPSVPLDFRGNVIFYALDPDTHIPVLANIVFEEQTHYAPTNPVGNSATFYPFKLPFRLVRVPNKEGHSDLVPPLVTVKAPGYPETSFRLPTTVPQMTVKMTPPPEHLRVGKNVVTVHAIDTATGKPVEARVMLGDRVGGDTNVPFVIEIKKKNAVPEIWVTSLFDRYSDAVIAKAR